MWLHAGGTMGDGTLEVDGRELVVARDDIGEGHVRPASVAAGDGQLLVEVEQVALTSNNVTYAVLGDRLSYWDAYPATDGSGDDDELGIVPAWGFGRVVGRAADVAGVELGERLYGLWPLATHAVLRPGRVDPHGLVDASPHRAALAGTYQRYERAAADELHDPATGELEPLYRPLFTTAFLLDDLLADDDEVGSLSTVVVTSASSKTATALAHLLARRSGLRAVGVTSASSVDHVDELGLWDEVVSYDEMLADRWRTDGRTALVDVAGRPAVVAAVHDAAADDLTLSLAVGATHHDASAPTSPPNSGPRPSMFFAPTRAAERVEQWGPGGFTRRLAAAWRPFVARVRDEVDVRLVAGLDAALDQWTSLVAGDVDPGEGLLVVPGGGR